MFHTGFLALNFEVLGAVLSPAACLTLRVVSISRASSRLCWDVESLTILLLSRDTILSLALKVSQTTLVTLYSTSCTVDRSLIPRVKPSIDSRKCGVSRV